MQFKYFLGGHARAAARAPAPALPAPFQTTPVTPPSLPKRKADALTPEPVCHRPRAGAVGKPVSPEAAPGAVSDLKTNANEYFEDERESSLKLKWKRGRSSAGCGLMFHFFTQIPVTLQDDCFTMEMTA